VYTITPATVFAEPERIQIPIPAGVAAESAALYYYGENAFGGAWYPVENVTGLLDGPVAISSDGAYLEAWVSHGGIVRAGRAPGVAIPLAGSLWPANYGTLVLLILTVGLLAFSGGRRNTKSS